MRWLVPVVLAVTAWLSLPQALAAIGPYEDVPIGALPADVVQGIVKKNLSPQGRFVILAATGNVRIFDAPQNIEQARKALRAMQDAPALVSFAFIIKTGMHKVTRVSSNTDSVATFPVPNTYSPPRIVQTGPRSYIVTPAMPTSFINEPLGVQENITTTSIEGGQARKFAGATLFPKPVAVTILARAPNPTELHDWAVKNGAVPQNEPAWPAARTEILVTPQHSDDGMVLNLQPQVVVAGADGAPRVIPFKTCTASVVVKPGTTVTFDGFPGADADFYRVFEGAQESTGDAISNVAIAAVVDYSQAIQQQAQPGAAQPQTPTQPVPPAAQPVRIQVQPSQQSSTLIDVQTTQ